MQGGESSKRKEHLEEGMCSKNAVCHYLSERVTSLRRELEAVKEENRKLKGTSEQVIALHEEIEEVKGENQKLKETMTNPSKRKLILADSSQPQKRCKVTTIDLLEIFEHYSSNQMKKFLIHSTMTGIVSSFASCMPNLESWIENLHLNIWKPLSEKLTGMEMVEEMFLMSKTPGSRTRWCESTKNLPPGSFLSAVVDSTLYSLLNSGSQSKENLSFKWLDSAVDLPETVAAMEIS